MSFSTTSSEEGAYWCFVRRLLGVAIGIIALVAIANVLVDPFQLSSRDALGLDQAALSDRRNDRLAELARFSRHPMSTIVLGDSRAKNLLESYFAAGGLQVSNLGFGGGTVVEAVDAFWFAARRAGLNKVIFVVSFTSWSEVDNGNLVPEAVDLVSHPWKYYFNVGIFRASAANVLANLRGRTRPNTAPSMTRSEFWKYQLEYNAESYLARHERPTSLRHKIAELGAFCRAQGISLIFVVPPTHRDLQRLVDAHHLGAEQREFIEFLRSSGALLDYNEPSSLTQDAANFSDPFHTTAEVSRLLAKDIVATQFRQSAAAVE